MTIMQQMAITEKIVPVTPGSSTFDSGATTFTVPSYNTLTVEIWGAGAAGTSVQQTPTVGVAGTAGGATSCSTLGMTANGGAIGGISLLSGAGGLGGTASGGNTTNTTGTTGGAEGDAATFGFGGGAPNGGGNVLTSRVAGMVNGTAGSVPGGGGSGAGQGSFSAASGAGSGAYSKSVYTLGVTSGAPAIGAALSYSVGVGGVGTSNFPGGSGNHGRIKFTWT